MRTFLMAITGLGVGLLVSGLLAFIFGGWVLGNDHLIISDFGPLNGVWAKGDYCFLGAAMAGVGAGLAYGGRLALRECRRD